MMMMMMSKADGCKTKTMNWAMPKQCLLHNRSSYCGIISPNVNINICFVMLWDVSVRWVLPRYSSLLYLDALERPSMPGPRCGLHQMKERSCDILTVLWQHVESVTPESSVCAVSQSVPSLLCVCERLFPLSTAGDDQAFWLISLAGILLSYRLQITVDQLRSGFSTILKNYCWSS